MFLDAVAQLNIDNALFFQIAQKLMRNKPVIGDVRFLKQGNGGLQGINNQK